MSDFALHRFALQSGPRFAKFRLSKEHICESGKFALLAELLPSLQVRSILPAALDTQALIHLPVHTPIAYWSRIIVFSIVFNLHGHVLLTLSTRTW